jgi:hypothetical protein
MMIPGQLFFCSREVIGRRLAISPTNEVNAPVGNLKNGDIGWLQVVSGG